MTLIDYDVANLITGNKWIGDMSEGVYKDWLAKVQSIEYIFGNDVEKLLSELGAVANNYGIRFPRAFTLVVKQFLYFDRYMQILAPGHNVFNDDRIDLLQ